MKILVTGANGQLGNEIRLIKKKYTNTDFDFHDVDTLNLLDNKELELYFTKNNPDFVINCAAYTAVDNAEKDKENALKGNCKIVANLVSNSKKHHSKFIHISTDYVFDGNNCIPYKEDDPVNPESEYGRTKLLGEKEALKYKNSVIIRTSWLYSSFGNNFVKTMLRLGKERDNINVIFDQIGTPTYAADLAESILEIINNSIKNNVFYPGIYHYSNEGVTSWYDFAWEIMNLSGINCHVFPIEAKDYPSPAKRPAYSLLNKNKIKTTYNLQIPNWKDSLKRCLIQLGAINKTE